MLTEIEKEGFRKILYKLDNSILFSLVDTVTKRQISVHGKPEAISAILTYTGSSLELLRRKKIKRDSLFQYLVQSNIVEAVTSDKSTLIKRILSHWGSEIRDDDDFDIEVDDDSSSLDLSIASSETRLLPAMPPVNRQFSNNIATGSGDVPQPLSWQQPFSANHTSHNVAINQGRPSQDIHQQLSWQQQPHSINHTYNNTFVINQSQPQQDIAQQHVSAEVVKTSVPSELLTMAKEFIDWFFKLLNSHNPLLIQQNNQQPLGDFGPHHFWEDVKLDLLLHISNDRQSDEYLGSTLVSQRFLAFVQEENLIFNPNISIEGLKVKSEAHGLVLIMTCGTIHRIGQCLGVFEQVFGLVRDPTIENNWKIKLCRLRIQSSDGLTEGSTLPRLGAANEFPAIGPS